MVSAETTSIRQRELFSLGMSKTSSGFLFQGISISFIEIENLMGDEWSTKFDGISKMIREKKDDISSRLSDTINKSDAEQTLDYLVALESIQEPNITDVILQIHIKAIKSQIAHSKQKAKTINS